jgi:excisionase family DNA binding protein
MTIIPIQQSNQTPERIGVNLQKAAAMLDISDRTLWRLAKEGKVPHKRLGKRLIFSVDELRKFISAD